MLTNITPGFYKMENGGMACLPHPEENEYMTGYFMCHPYKYPQIYQWKTKTGEAAYSKHEYDLVERIEKC